MTLFPPEAVVRRLSLVRLTSEIARSVAQVGRVATEGEVVRPSVRPSGRIWFTLRDRAVQLTVVCPPARARRCRVVHGERVGVTGTLGWSADRGDLRLVAEEVVPVGEGAIVAALAETRARLEADGLLDRPRRPLPVLPAGIGVVCGSDAAVRADIESVVAARYPGYPVVFREVAVQGPGAAASVVEGLRALDATPGIEVVVLARGGGGEAALLPFSDEELCRAIGATATPVVSAIGHDRDRPLCDEVADLRCGTPSLAAAAVVPDRAALQRGLDEALAGAARAGSARVTAGRAALDRLDRDAAIHQGLEAAAHRLELAGRRLGDLDLDRRAARCADDLAARDWRAPLARRLHGAQVDLRGRRRTVEALDPARVLARGYAVLRGAGGGVVRDPADVAAGEVVRATLAHGELSARVLDHDEGSG